MWLGRVEFEDKIVDFGRRLRKKDVNWEGE